MLGIREKQRLLPINLENPTKAIDGARGQRKNQRRGNQVWSKIK